MKTLLASALAVMALTNAALAQSPPAHPPASAPTAASPRNQGAQTNAAQPNQAQPAPGPAALPQHREVNRPTQQNAARAGAAGANAANSGPCNIVLNVSTPGSVPQISGNCQPTPMTIEIR